MKWWHWALLLAAAAALAWWIWRNAGGSTVVYGSPGSGGTGSGGTGGGVGVASGGGGYAAYLGPGPGRPAGVTGRFSGGGGVAAAFKSPRIAAAQQARYRTFQVRAGSRRNPNGAAGASRNIGSLLNWNGNSNRGVGR